MEKRMTTPLPWDIWSTGVSTGRSPTTRTVCITSAANKPLGDAAADVRHLRRAVNNYERLVQACRLALPVLKDQHAALAPEMHGGTCPDREAMFAIEAALTAIEGEQE